jgi:hypothetical protein
MCSFDHCSMYYNCSILHLASCVSEVVEFSFHDEFIDYSPCFLLPCSYGLDHCSYGLDPKRERWFVSSALVTTHVCSIVVFISCIDTIFS